MPIVPFSNLAGQGLAILLITIGLTGIGIHLAHRHVRRKVYLTAHPGTIASIVALTSHSGFGELLYPYDDKRTIRRKLANLRFSLDKRTGAIVAEELEAAGAPDENDESTVFGEDVGEMKDVELSRIGSRAPLWREDDKPSSSKGSPPRPISSLLDVPYEHEPLVIDRPRSASRSPDTGYSPLPPV